MRWMRLITPSPRNATNRAAGADCDACVIRPLPVVDDGDPVHHNTRNSRLRMSERFKRWEIALLIGQVLVEILAQCFRFRWREREPRPRAIAFSDHTSPYTPFLPGSALILAMISVVEIPGV